MPAPRSAALLLLGQPRQAVIQCSGRQYGASRGSFYNVHYISDVSREGRLGGTATARGNYSPAGSLHVRYLRACPDISHPGTNALLAFYALLWMFPGMLLALAGVRLLPGGWM